MPGMKAPALTFGSDSKLSGDIKSSSDYGGLIYNTILPGVTEGKMSGGFIDGDENYNDPILNFNKGVGNDDLFLAIHSSEYTYTVSQNEHGDYDIAIMLMDTFDFTEWGKFEGLSELANKKGIIDQKAGVINPFDFTAQISDTASKEVVDSYR